MKKKKDGRFISRLRFIQLFFVRGYAKIRQPRLSSKFVLDEILHLARDALRLFRELSPLFGFGHKAYKPDGGGNARDVTVKGGVASSFTAHIVSPSAFCF